MSEISNYEAQKKKLQGLCDEHNFTFRFFKDRYPITLVITPINDIATQMDMLGNVEGFISVSDPACGAGATLLAFLNICKSRNICYHNKVLVVAQDIDFIVGLMCYIQCSFMGCAGYVVIGDTIADPATAYDDRGLLPAGPQNRIWYMPFFSTDVWYMRRQIAQMNLLFEPKGEPAKIEKTDIKPANLQKSIKNEPKTPENEPLNETKTGQLTFF